MRPLSDRLLILGGTGLLGSKVVNEAVRQGYSVIAPKRADFNLSINGQVTSLLAFNTNVKAIINCCGATIHRKYSVDDMIKLNSYLPHKIAQWAEAHKVPVYHISTDCVFSGKSGYNSVETNPDPVDIYGRSKLLGEANNPFVYNIRTSFIGFGGPGLLEWLISKKGQDVFGWAEAFWSGTSTTKLAEDLLDFIAQGFRPLNNVEHFATQQGVSKYDLLCVLNEALKLECNIIPVIEPRIYRILHPTIVLPSIQHMVDDLVKEYYSLKIAS